MSEAWKATTIGECLDAAFSGEWGAEPKPANALVFRATDIDDEGRIVGAGAPRRLPIGKLTAKQLRDGDILLEGSGGGPGKPVGRVAYFSGDAQGDPAVCSNFFKTLRPAREKVAPRFLVRKLWWFHKQAPILALQQQTTGIINLKFEEYLASQISIPLSVSEQGKIAQILDTLDTAIHETEAIIAKLKAVKQGLLHDLLTRGIDANGELRPPQVEAPHLYKQSPLGWIPNAWTAGRLGDIAQKIQDGTHFSPTLGGEDHLYVTSRNIRFGYMDLAEVDRIDRRQHNAIFRRCDPKYGDLLITKDGANTGNAALNICEEEISLLSSVAFARFDAAADAAGFHLHYVLCPIGQQRIKDLMSGNAITRLTLTKIRGFLVPRPPVAEQLAILASLDQADSRLAMERASVDNLRAMKAGLMDDLLTGRVRATPQLEEAERAEECA